MGAAAHGGRGFKERTSGQRPIGAAICRQQYNQTSCQPPPPARVCQQILRGKKLNFANLVKGTGFRAIVSTQTLGSQTPPPSPSKASADIRMTLKKIIYCFYICLHWRDTSLHSVLYCRSPQALPCPTQPRGQVVRPLHTKWHFARLSPLYCTQSVL